MMVESKIQAKINAEFRKIVAKFLGFGGWRIIKEKAIPKQNWLNYPWHNYDFYFASRIST